MMGSVVGHYKITASLGEGGMGAVYQGVDLMLEREVAVKMLRPELARQPQVVERFRSEAVTLAKLNHPNIATLYEFFRQGDDFFMVMEFVHGETLERLIRRTGAMSCEQATPLFCQALEGIYRAHQLGIIHRDIKPANLMITDQGLVKVMDFGIARVLGSARMTRQGNIVGTIEYMSPEQVLGKEATAQSDIYSLGILLYEMLTGRVPFSSPSEFELMKAQIEAPPPPPRSFVQSIPLPIEQAIMRALAKNPEARFASAQAFESTIQAGITGAPLAPSQPANAPYPAPVTPPTRLAATTPVPGGVNQYAGAVSGEAARANFNSPSSSWTPPQSGAIGPTRLGTIPAIAPRPISVQLTDLFKKLDWKYWVLGGSAFMAMGAILVAFLLSGGKAPAPTTTPTPQAQPAAVATPPEAPAPDLVLPESHAGSSVSTDHDVERPSSPRRRARRAQPPPEQSAPTEVAGSGGTSPSSPSKVNEPSNGNKGTGKNQSTAENGSSSGKKNDKSSVENDDKKGSKVGNAFKKIGGFFKRGKKDKDKK